MARKSNHPGVSILLQRAFTHLAETLPDELARVSRDDWQEHLQRRFDEVQAAFTRAEPYPPTRWFGPNNVEIRA